MISTRGRYALRVLVDLAEHGGGSYLPMKEVANRQEISLKYLERIVPLLTREHLLEGQSGKGGGYRLGRPAEEIRVGDVLRLTEGDLAPVSCLSCGAAPCPRAASCRTLPMWQEYARRTNEFFDGITLADLMAGLTAPEYVI